MTLNSTCNRKPDRTAGERPPLSRRRRTCGKRTGPPAKRRPHFCGPIGHSTALEDVTNAAGDCPRRDDVGAAEDGLEVVEALLVGDVQHVELDLERQTVLLEPGAQRSVPKGARLKGRGGLVEANRGGRVGVVRAGDDV